MANAARINFNNYYDLAFEYMAHDAKKALDYIELACASALNSGDSLFITKSYRVGGQILYVLERYDEARKDLKRAMAMAGRLGFHRERGKAMSTLVAMLVLEARYDDALDMGYRRLELLNMLPDSIEYSVTHNSIGLVYYKLKDYGKAVSHFRRALDYRGNVLSRREHILMNISLAMVADGRYDQADSLIKVAQSHCERMGCEGSGIMSILYAQGWLAEQRHAFEDATNYYRASLNMARKVADSRFKLDNLTGLARIYLRTGQSDSLQAVLTDAEQVLGHDPPFALEAMKLHREFGNYYDQAGEHAKASRHHLRYALLHDSLYSAETINGLIKVNVERIEKDFQERMDMQKRLVVAKDELLSRQSWINRLLILLGVFVMGLFAMVLRDHRRGKRVRVMLERTVRSRTRDLQTQRTVLERRLAESESRFELLARKVRAQATSIRGLCDVARRDTGDTSVLDCLSAIEESSQGMLL